MEAMAARCVAGAQVKNFTVIAILAQHGNHPMYRPDKLFSTSAPAHTPCNRQARNAALYYSVESIPRSHAGDGFLKTQPRPLRGIDTLQLLRRYALFFSETDAGVRPVPRFVSRAIQRRPQNFDYFLGCF